VVVVPVVAAAVAFEALLDEADADWGEKNFSKVMEHVKKYSSFAGRK
jgi:hypothetical protein